MTDPSNPMIEVSWWSRRTRWQKVALIVLTVLVALGVIGSVIPAEEDPVAGGTTTTVEAGDTTTTTEVGDTTTTTESDAETATTTVAPPTTTPPAFLLIADGSGDDVLTVDLPPDEALIVTFTHAGSSNFAVTSYTASNEYIDLLVNEIGDYEGTRPLQFDFNNVALLEITANGPWTVKISDLSTIDIQFCGDPARHGDDVVSVPDFLEAGGAATLTHNGESNFAIVTYSDFGADLIVNEIGAYEGTVLIDAGMFVWDVSADGEWTIDC